MRRAARTDGQTEGEMGELHNFKLRAAHTHINTHTFIGHKVLKQDCVIELRQEAITKGIMLNIATIYLMNFNIL